jgi:hypothetical protein
MKRRNPFVLTLILIGIQSNILLAQLADTLYYDNEMNLLNRSEVSNADYFEVRILDRKGRQDGISRLYNIAGNLISETEFSKGKKSGVYLLYEADGNKTMGRYKNDFKIGPWMQVKSDTMLLRIDYYEKDILVDSRDFMNEIVIEPAPDVEPTFPGGPKAWNDFLRLNLTYPQQARAYKIQGQVFLEFLVLQDGKVVNPIVTGSPSPLLSAEGIRILYLSPEWIPGQKDGKPVASLMKIKISFKTK